MKIIDAACGFSLGVSLTIFCARNLIRPYARLAKTKMAGDVRAANAQERLAKVAEDMWTAKYPPIKTKISDEGLKDAVGEPVRAVRYTVLPLPGYNH